MNIILNNRKEEIEGGQMTVAELLKYKNYTFKLLITRINGELIKKDARDQALIKDGDDVTVLHMISGG